MATTGSLVYNRELFYEATKAPARKTSLSNRTLHAVIHVGKVVKNRRVYLFFFLGTNGFHVQAKNERFSAEGCLCLSEPHIRKFHVANWQSR